MPENPLCPPCKCDCVNKSYLPPEPYNYTIPSITPTPEVKFTDVPGPRHPNPESASSRFSCGLMRNQRQISVTDEIIEPKFVNKT